MMLTIKINMDNDDLVLGFEGSSRSQAVKQIINDALKNKITTGEIGVGALVDANGNTVGYWEVTND